jgi:superfamily II DNA/RNA helicase
MHFITPPSASTEQKAEIIARFSPISQKTKNLVPRGNNFLFTTDVLSEGQILQDCDIVVNYDFHWNPVRLIQRIGSVDRMGSTSDLINDYNFLTDTRIEEHLDLQGRV